MLDQPPPALAALLDSRCDISATGLAQVEQEQTLFLVAATSVSMDQVGDQVCCLFVDVTLTVPRQLLFQLSRDCYLLNKQPWITQTTQAILDGFLPCGSPLT